MTAPVATITGAASGIGRQLALLLAADGYRIAAIDVQEPGLRALADELTQRGTPCVWAVGDVTEAAAFAETVADLEGRLGPTDLLIASAGIGLETSGLAYRADEVARVINVNLIGVSNSIAAVLPGMLARGRGHIVGLSSVASFRGVPRMLAYCASKAGLNALLDGLRVEVEPRGVRVTTVCPGWVRTPMTATIRGRLDHLMEPEEAARHIVRAIHRRAAFYAFPRRMVMRLRALAWLPLSWQDHLIRKMLGRVGVARSDSPCPKR